MAMLTPPEALPALLLAVMRHVQAEGRVHRELLHKRFAPQALFDEPRGPDDGAYGSTVAMGRSIGVLHGGTVRDPEVRLDEEFESFSDEINAAVLRSWTMRIDADDPDPYSMADGKVVSTGCRDMQRALAWFLTLDPRGPALTWTSKKVHSVDEHQQTLPRHLWPFENSTRWGGFTRWATLLGFTRPRPSEKVDGFVPDLYVPTRDEIGGLLTDDPKELAGVLDRLAARLPVIAGGQIRGYMLKHLQSQQDGVDVALAQALLRLESEGVIALSTVQDYTISNPSGIVRLLSGSREERAFTHIAQGVSA